MPGQVAGQVQRQPCKGFGMRNETRPALERGPGLLRTLAIPGKELLRLGKLRGRGLEALEKIIGQ